MKSLWHGITDHPSFVVVVLLMAAFWAQGYSFREDGVTAARAQCQRGQANTHDTLEFDYAAYIARSNAAMVAHEGPQGVDSLAAASYLVVVRDYMRRTDSQESLVWPDPRVSGVHGPFRHPLGLGHFSCIQANPKPSPFHI